MDKHTLKSMTDFVLEKDSEFTINKHLYETNWNLEFEKFCKLNIRYAKFLKQPLKLGMFVPCDEYDNPLEDPFKKDGRPAIGVYEKYKQAKERVLFKNCEFDGIDIIIENSILLNANHVENLTLESLVYANLYLTESAVKQIYN